MLLNKVCLIYLDLNSTSSKTVWTVCVLCNTWTKKRYVIHVSHHQLQRLLHMYAYICWQQHVPKDWGSCKKQVEFQKLPFGTFHMWTGPLLTGDSTMAASRKGHPWLAQSITSEYGAMFRNTVCLQMIAVRLNLHFTQLPDLFGNRVVKKTVHLFSRANRLQLNLYNRAEL